MNSAVKILLYFIFSIVISLIIAPLVIKLMSKVKAKQNILNYVTQHEHKSGTPTMGGIIFLIPTIIFSLIEFNSFSVVALAITLGYSVIGFLDDYIKIKNHRNLGLKSYQKIIAQLGLAGVITYFCFSSEFIGSTINLPATQVTFDMNYGYIVFVIVLYIATTNAVNLTDGLDGLAGYSSVAYFIGFTVLLYLSYVDAKILGDIAYSEELLSLTAFSVSILGGLLGYLCFNTYPSKIMMGDTGSMALGSAVATVAIFSKNPLLIAFSGIIFVWSCISVIVQVLYFKCTKKRIFLMSPFHHHLEIKGMHESRIVSIYFVISLIGGAVSLIFARAV